MACESFITYADDKLMLADGINMDEEELWGLLIEGIPKGRIQCFADVRDIKRVFSEVKLPKVYETDRQTVSMQLEGTLGQRVQEATTRKRIVLYLW